MKAITAPTMNFVPDRGVRYAISIDDEPLQVVTRVPPGYQAQNRNRDWGKSVADNARAVDATVSCQAACGSEPTRSRG